MCDVMAKTRWQQWPFALLLFHQQQTQGHGAHAANAFRQVRKWIDLAHIYPLPVNLYWREIRITLE